MLKTQAAVQEIPDSRLFFVQFTDPEWRARGRGS